MKEKIKERNSDPIISVKTDVDISNPFKKSDSIQSNTRNILNKFDILTK